jgi:chorismate synthase
VVHYTTAGESHGQKLIAIIEGIPAGVKVSTADIRAQLALRRGGIGRGERQKFEQDEVSIISGVIHGETIGSPIAVEILNSEWSKWDQIMSPDPVFGEISQAQPNVRSGEEGDKLVRPRPGHADLEAMRKYGFPDSRAALERSSARETAARVAVGAIAKCFLAQVCGIEIVSDVVQFGGMHYCPPDENGEYPKCGRSPCASTREEFEAMATEIAREAREHGETIGGVVEVQALGVPYGLGSYISASARLDSALSGALMSIQAFKGVEIGDGFAIASTPGTLAHDKIVRDVNGRITRSSNHAGGIEGGISNGMPIVLRGAVKPIPSIPSGLQTINTVTGEEALAHSQRSDVSAVYPAAVVANSVVGLVLADFVTRKFGADTLTEVRRNLQSFQENVPENVR